jgi:hypothetical protein
MPHVDAPEDNLKDQVALFLLTIYPEGADPETRWATYSEYFLDKSNSTYDLYYRESRQRFGERGLTDLEENITPSGL